MKLLSPRSTLYFSTSAFTLKIYTGCSCCTCCSCDVCTDLSRTVPPPPHCHPHSASSEKQAAGIFLQRSRRGGPDGRTKARRLTVGTGGRRRSCCCRCEVPGAPGGSVRRRVVLRRTVDTEEQPLLLLQELTTSAHTAAPQAACGEEVCATQNKRLPATLLQNKSRVVICRLNFY